MSSPRAGRRYGRSLPWLLVVAVLLSIGSAVFKLTSGARRNPYAPPVVADPDQPLEAFAGEAERSEDGARASYRLTRLYADPSRQAFEAKSLRERFHLPEGEPWRLTVHTEGASAAPAQVGRALGVADERGAALVDVALLIADQVGHEGSPADPVRTAFGDWSSSDGKLRTSVLWGRRPGDGARSAWISAAWQISEANDLERATLELSSVHRSELEVPLARLERTGDGKKSGSGASVGGGGAPQDGKR